MSKSFTISSSHVPVVVHDDDEMRLTPLDVLRDIEANLTAYTAYREKQAESSERVLRSIHGMVADLNSRVVGIKVSLAAPEVNRRDM